MRRTSINGVVIGIPRAGRAGELLTLDYLERIGVPRERIILSVQSKADLEDYTAAGVCERVRALIYGPARNAAGNRNNLLNAVEQGTELLMLDDDIRDIVRLDSAADGTLSHIDTFPALLRLAAEGFAAARKKGAWGFGITGFYLAEYMRFNVRTAAICGGAVLGIITGEARFNPEYDTKEDYAFCCESITQTGAFPQLEYCSALSEGRHAGGCWEAWNDIKTVRADTARICEKYPGIVEKAGTSGTLIRMKRIRMKRIREADA